MSARMRSVLVFVHVVVLAAVTVTAMPALANKRVALVIANSRYQEAPLATVANDGRQVAEALRRLGIETVLVTDAGGRAMNETIARFEKSANSADIAFIYYAGYAIQYRHRNRLVPVDARLATEKDLTALPVAERLLDSMKGAKARVLVMDASRDASALLRNLAAGAARDIRPGLAMTDVSSGTLVLTSSGPGKIAADGAGTTSPFATALINELPTPRDLEGMATRVRMNVTRATGGAQAPSVMANFETEEKKTEPWQHVSAGGERAKGPSLAPEPNQPRSVAIVPVEPPPPSSPPRRETQVLPTFPWPPPAASVTYLLPKALVARHTTVGDLTDAIVGALEKSGYVERSFYETPVGGVVLMTRLERIDDDGSPARAGSRWGDAPQQADIVQFLSGLFFASPGRYRIIVFVVQDQPFTQDTDKTLSSSDAQKMLRRGANALPKEVAKRPVNEPQCTALIYEFAHDGTAMKRVGSRLTARQHLEKAGILAQLERSN